ncbi:MAG: ABC transporter permease [Flammeovirgaceae bacterium TMED290]|nr:MAG: ABC transporter permease [Flammeovirgaceae bacterium TMED290]|tara:strand:+ start:13133 stop:14455 length:1323 start_codon:yes stop_codon:yes gene_type:complete
MDKIWIILEREYLQRVKKKSFILSTILTPLIFPLFIAITVFVLSTEESEERIILLLDENNLIEDSLEFQNNVLIKSYVEISDIQYQIDNGQVYGALEIPKLDIYDPKDLKFYSKNVPGGDLINGLESLIESRIRDLKIQDLNLNEESLKKLKTRILMETYTIDLDLTEDSDDEVAVKQSNSDIAFGLGYFNGFLIYMFVFIYGSFILQSVLDEKTSKVVEVIVSSIKPIQLMMGKVLGVGAVAFTQIFIWIILVTSISTLTSMYFGINSYETTQIIQSEEEISNSKEMVKGIYEMFGTIDIKKTILIFLIYFLGGFFLYGAFFAAIGSAVDNLQDASQFTLPISLPIIASLMFMGIVLNNPEGNASIFLSMFPLTSPILMMARLSFGVPDWHLFISISILIISVVFALWFAGRIYRVGILTSGSKISYKLLWKWFIMKNY